MDGSLLAAALEYDQRGWCVIPMLLEAKTPACRWKRYQAVRPSPTTLRRWFSGPTPFGMAVVFGGVSGNLGSRDFDEAAAYDRWAATHPELAAKLPTVRTHRGRHVYFRTEPGAVAEFRRSIGKPDGTGAIHAADGELRIGTGCYSLAPPSPHRKGGRYHWDRPPGATIPLVTDFAAAGLWSPCHREDGGEQRKIEAIGGERHAGGERSGSAVTFPDASPELAAQIEQAIAATLPSGYGQRNKLVFEFARWLKAIAVFTEAGPRDLEPFVREWHRRALPFISTTPVEETLVDFYKGWPKVRFARGQEPMARIVARAAAEIPKVADRYESPHVRMLVALCRELQRASGAAPFFLSCAKAGECLGVDPKSANRWLYLLQIDQILAEVEKGSRSPRRATRWRYLPPL